MPALSDDARKKIAKVLPSLARTNVNEVAATVSVIGQILKGDGCDWFDLAKTLTERVQVATFTADNIPDMAAMMRGFGGPYSPRTRAPPRDTGTASRTAAEHRAKQVKGGIVARDMLAVVNEIEGCIDSLDSLGEQACDFLNRCRDRSKSFQIVKITAKQDAWLRGIARRHGVDIPWDEIAA